jgi:hypothetical protein
MSTINQSPTQKSSIGCQKTIHSLFPQVSKTIQREFPYAEIGTVNRITVIFFRKNKVAMSR